MSRGNKVSLATKKAIAKHYAKGLSYREIGEKVGMNVTAVNGSIYIMRKKGLLEEYASLPPYLKAKSYGSTVHEAKKLIGTPTVGDADASTTQECPPVIQVLLEADLTVADKWSALQKFI